MVTVWNPADEAQDFVFTLFFDGGHYFLPLHMQPRETRSFNVSEIIQNQVPDAEGNLVPPTVHQGTAKIAGRQAENQHILVAVESGIYNVRKATCSQNCQECDGYNSFYVIDSPFSVGVNGTHQESAMAQYHSGSQYNMTSGSSWGSSKTTVATVGTGLVTGKAPGSATITATFSNEPVDAGYVCLGGSSCPLSTFTNSGGGTTLQVTNVLPSNLVLGGSGVLTIYGSGFQSLLSPIAQFDPSSGITTGTPSITSDTQMTVSYQVTCSALLGNQTLQIGTSIDGGLSEATWPETVVLPSAPAPTMKFGGNTISGTQSVVVGQQVALSSSVSLPPCTSISAQQWSVPGTTVGGFNTGATNGGPVATNFTQATNTFYWVNSGNSLNVTYQYTMSGGGGAAPSPTTSATFNIAGPSNPGTAVALGTINISNNKLVFGGSGTNIGIKFTPSATAPSGYSNTWVYVQVISSLTIQLTGSTSHTCTGSGLDGNYPYPPVTSTYTDDNPGVGLSTSYTEESDTMSANMYVLWSSGLANSIPVPIGYVTWSWYGDAKYSSGAWHLQGSSTRSANAFQASSSYPTWTTNYPLGSTCP